MNSSHGLMAIALGAALLAGMAVAQTPPAEDASKPSAQAQFDAAKDLYEKDIGYFNDAVVHLREANKANNGMSCSYANLTVVSLASAQNQLEIMMTLMEAAHQDASAYHAAYDENATQLTQRKASLDRSGCG